MKIESTGKAYVPSQVQDARAPAQRSKAPVQSGGDSVQLSPLATLMKKAESAISESPEIDQKRVDEIRQAISEGRFKVDASRIADGLIASVRDMLGSRG
ncbi:flagellar biosynthesis anti-sigma factor FlgM [Thauera sp.]|uniref:flagellar biosynthesis anti-sigma factor FlgM n=1 Tax=Thauera sp. TaxID=1905334 RepID=UPI0039E4E7D7